MFRQFEESRSPVVLVRLMPFLGLALTVLVAFNLAVSLRWGITHDATLMYYVGREVANGARTGLGLFEMNTPLVHWIQAGLYVLFGVSDKAWRAFDLAILAAICVFGYRLIQPLTGRIAWAAVLFIVMLHLHGGDTMAGQRDVVMLVPVLGACLLLTGAGEGKNAFATLAAAGALLAVGALLKPNAVVYSPLMAAAVVATRRDLWRPHPLAAFGAPLVVGFLVPCLVVFLVLYLQGALGEFVSMWVNYLIPVYGKVRAPRAELVSHVFRDLLALAVLGILAYLLRIRIELEVRLALLIAVVAGGLVGYFIQGKGWNYQSIPFHYTAILLATVLAVAIFRSGMWGGWIIAAATAVLLPPLMLEVAVQSSSEASKFGTAHSPSLFARTLMADLDIHVPHGLPVQVLDTTHGGIEALLRSDRHQPTRFIYDFQFYLGGESPYRKALRSEFLSALSAAGPHALVVTNQQWPDAPGFSRIDDATEWPELHRLLATRYVLVASKGTGTGNDRQYRIYRSSP
jgi:hypothetical protein